MPRQKTPPARIQGVTFACGHRGLFQHTGTIVEGKRVARILARGSCRKCDPAASPVTYYDRIGLDAILATEATPDPA